MLLRLSPQGFNQAEQLDLDIVPEFLVDFLPPFSGRKPSGLDAVLDMENFDELQVVGKDSLDVIGHRLIQLMDSLEVLVLLQGILQD